MRPRSLSGVQAMSLSTSTRGIKTGSIPLFSSRALGGVTPYATLRMMTPSRTAVLSEDESTAWIFFAVLGATGSEFIQVTTSARVSSRAVILPRAGMIWRSAIALFLARVVASTPSSWIRCAVIRSAMVASADIRASRSMTTAAKLWLCLSRSAMSSRAAVSVSTVWDI